MQDLHHTCVPEVLQRWSFSVVVRALDAVVECDALLIFVPPDTLSWQEKVSNTAQVSLNLLVFALDEIICEYGVLFEERQLVCFLGKVAVFVGKFLGESRSCFTHLGKTSEGTTNEMYVSYSFVLVVVVCVGRELREIECKVVHQLFSHHQLLEWRKMIFL